MDMAEMNNLVRGSTPALMRKAREHGFRGHTQAGAKRFLLLTWLQTVRPSWTYALDATQRQRQFTREGYYAERRINRMTRKLAKTLEERLHTTARGLDRTLLPHSVSVLHSVVVCDQAAVRKHAASYEHAQRVGAFGRTIRKGGRIPAKLQLAFRYESAVQFPFVGVPTGTKAGDAIIMDAWPIDGGHRVLYTKNAAGATVALAEGLYFAGRLYKTTDETRARKQALAYALAGGA